MIKYKGQTAAILTDLSRELNRPVNLKESEMILAGFFHNSLQQAGIEKSIQLLTNLPPFLKPFYFLSREDGVPVSELFSEKLFSSTNKAVMKVLEKYINPANLAAIYACLPENLFIHTISFRKEILQRAS